MKCSYCYSHNENISITKEQNKVIVEKLIKLNCRSIALIGGEPLCNSDFWEILDQLKSVKAFDDITIITNGTLFDVDRISCLEDSRVSIQISLDDVNEIENAKTRGKGQVEKVLNILPLLIEKGVDVRVMKVITRDNIQNVHRFFDYFRTRGIQAGFFIVKQVDDNLKPTTKQLKHLLDYLHKEWSLDVLEIFDCVKFADNMMFGNEGFPITHCGAGVTSLSIHPDGNVYPCVKRYSINNLITNIFFANAIVDIIKNRKMIIENDLVDGKKKCKNCSIKYFCGGGCRAEEKNDMICEYNCNYFRFALEYYAEKKYQ